MAFKENMKRIASLARSPKAFTIYGIVGVGVTAALAAVGAWYAKDIWNQKPTEDDDPEIFRVKKIGKVIGCGIPALISGTFTISSIVKANNGYSDSIETLKNIIDSQSVNEAMTNGLLAGVALKEAYPGFYEADDNSNENVYYDEISKRYFTAPESRILEAEIKINRAYLKHSAISTNYLFALYGLEPTPEGWNQGWTWDTFIDGFADRNIEIVRTPMGDEGNRYFKLSYPIMPVSPLEFDSPKIFEDTSYYE